MYWYKNGQGSIIIRVKLYDSSVTTGAGLTALTSASSGLIISTIADNEATPTTYTQAGSTIETITTLGTYAAPTATKCRFKLVDNTNHPGIYEIQLADARFAVANAKSLLISWSGVTNLAQGDIVIPLTGADPYTATNFGLSAIPTANHSSSGGLLTFGTGTGQVNPSSGAVTTTYTIKKNTAFNNFEFQLVLASDHVSPAPGLTVTCERSIDGGAYAACANGATSISAGTYKINLANTDLNGNMITFKFSAATADTTYISVVTQS